MHLLQIGCGAIGTLLAEASLRQGHAITIVRKSTAAIPVGANVIQADVVSGHGLDACKPLQPDVLIYCLAPGRNYGQTYQQTYVEGLRNVLNHLDHLSTIKHVFFISSTRVYGESHGEWVDDQTVAQPSDIEGATLLAAEQLLEGLPCPHTALRISGIYGPERQYLLRMAQQPQSWPQQATWSNRIHEADVVGAIMCLYEKIQMAQLLPTHMILTDGSPTLQHEVLQWLANAMQWPMPNTPPLTPQGGKRLRNQQLQAMGYTYKFKDYQAGYGDILKTLMAQA